MNVHLRRVSISTPWPRTDPRVQMWRRLEMVSGRPALGFGAPTHTHTRCSPVTLDFPIVPFSATVLSSTSRARRIFLQAPRSQLTEEVAPPGVFLSFSRIPRGEVISQMEREGKEVRSLSVLAVRQKHYRELMGDLRRSSQLGVFRESAGSNAVFTSSPPPPHHPDGGRSRPTPGCGVLFSRPCKAFRRSSALYLTL